MVNNAKYLLTNMTHNGYGGKNATAQTALKRPHSVLDRLVENRMRPFFGETEGLLYEPGITD